MKWSSSGSTSGSLGCPIESLRRAFYWTICFLRTGGLTKSFPPSLLSLWTTPYVPEWRVCCWLLVRPRIPVPNQDRTVPDRSAPSVSGSNQCRPLPPPPLGRGKAQQPWVKLSLSRRRRADLGLQLRTESLSIMRNAVVALAALEARGWLRGRFVGATVVLGSVTDSC